MENNKEIGKAFREKLDQLDRIPNDALWSKIDNDLESKKKKKPIFWYVPLWILSGLLLGGLSYSYLTKNNGTPNPGNPGQDKIVLGETQEKNKTAVTSVEKNNASAEGKKTFRKENKAITQGRNTITEAKKTSTEVKYTITEAKKASTEEKRTLTEQKKASTERKNAITEAKKASTEGKKTLTEQKKTSTERKNAITEAKKASTEGKKTLTEQKKASAEGNNAKTGSRNPSYKTVQYSEQVRTVKKTKRLVKSTDEYDEYEVVQKYTYIIKKKKKTLRIPDKKTYASKKKIRAPFDRNKPKTKPSSKATKQPADNTGLTLVESGKSNQEPIGAAIDTAAAVIMVAAIEPKIVPKKEIKKPIPEDSIKTEKEKKHNIYISPYFGPTAYESFAKGNPVSGQYRNDPKKAVLTYSYGCYVRWMFGDKTGSRTGVGKTNLEYTTNIRKSNVGSIDTNNINLDSGITTSEINNHFENWVDEEVTMTQKLSYFEVPLEAYYVFSDHKIGVATSFGLSFLFVDENELTLKSNSVKEYKIGSAKNVLDQSMTGNLRLILDYKLTKSLKFEVSPSFQYHVLGYKNASDFKPYILSLQAGFSYRL